MKLLGNCPAGDFIGHAEDLELRSFKVTNQAKDLTLFAGDYVIVKAPDAYSEIEWSIAQIEGINDIRDSKLVYQCSVYSPLDNDGYEVVNPDIYWDWSRKPIDIAAKPPVIKPEWKFLIPYFNRASLPGTKLKDSPIRMYIGELMNYPPGEDIPVTLDGKKMNCHTCMLAQSGSGKSYALGLLLEELLINVKAQIIVIDPNSDLKEFSTVKSTKDINTKKNKCKIIDDIDREVFVNKFNQDNDNRYNKIYQFSTKKPEIVPINDKPIPATLAVNFSELEIPEIKAFLELEPRLDHDIAIALNASRKYAWWEKHGNYTINEFLELTGNLIKRLLAEDQEVQESLEHFINLFGGSHRLAFALGRLWERTYVLSSRKIWRETTDQQSFLRFLEDNPREHMIHLDFGNFHPDERGMLALAVFEKLWERNERDKNRPPTFIVIDEAHNIVPAHPENQWQVRSSEWVNRIAGEGRKYGLFLILVSQSPSKIHPHTLSQCQNTIIMKITNQEDLKTIEKTFSTPSETLLDTVTEFSLGDALITGKFAPCPLLVRFGRRRTKFTGEDIKLEPMPT